MKSVKHLVLAGIIFGFIAACTAEKTIRLTSGEWKPYISKDLKHFGVVSRIVADAFALEGIKVEYEFFPTPEALTLARDGEWDGTLVWHYTEERAKNFIYSDPVMEGQGVFFHLKSTAFEWKTFDDLKGRTIGAVSGFSNGEPLNNAEKSGQLVLKKAPSEAISFGELLAKRTDLYTSNLYAGYAVLNEHFDPKDVQRVTHHTTPHYSQPLYLILSNKIERNRELVKLFNQGLTQLRASGKYDQYFEESRNGDYLKN